MQLPVPMMNVINGGAHANNNLDLQELMIIPVGAPSFREAVRYGAEVFHALKKIIHDKRHEHRGRRRRRLRAERGEPRGGDPADPARRSTRPATRPATQIALGLDCAASEFYKDGKYVLGRRGPDADAPRVDRHPGHLGRQVPDHQHRGRHGRRRLGRLEAPAPTAWASKVQLVGDDLFVTNTKILKEGIDKRVANSILIKINQIGTLTETFAAIEMAKRAGYTAVISHRSGETEDSTIADIAVGTNAGQIKTGSMSRSDRIAKYNQLLRIEEDLGDVAELPGPRGVLQPALSETAAFATERSVLTRSRADA